MVERPQCINLMVGSQYKADDENESQIEHFKVEESDDLLVSCGAKLKSKLYRENEVYKKND